MGDNNDTVQEPSGHLWSEKQIRSLVSLHVPEESERGDDRNTYGCSLSSLLVFLLSRSDHSFQEWKRASSCVLH